MDFDDLMNHLYLAKLTKKKKKLIKKVKTTFIILLMMYGRPLYHINNMYARPLYHINKKDYKVINEVQHVISYK